LIVDVHVHAPTSHLTIPDDEGALNISRLNNPISVPSSVTLEDMTSALEPVDLAFVFGIWWRAGDPRPPGENVNDETADVIRSDPEKLVGFMSVHPDAPGVIDEIERCVRELGFRGMKLGPNYQVFDPLSDNARRVYAAAQEIGLPIVFHQGTAPVRYAPLRYAHPLVMDEIALEFPDLSIVMAHMGHPWFMDTISVIRKHPNVFADISGVFYRPWSAYNALMLATEWGVLDKLLFATDWPIASPDEAMDGLRNVNRVVEGTRLPEVPIDELEPIIHRDAVALLRMAL
jgi:uncharacterized protein